MVWFQCVMCWDTSPGTNLNVLKLMWSTHPSHLWEMGMEPAHSISCQASKFFAFGHFCFSKFNNNSLPLCSLSHQNSKVFFWKILFCVYVSICESVSHMGLVPTVGKRVAVELELWWLWATLFVCQVRTEGTQVRSSAKAATVLSFWAISPAPNRNLLK